MIPVASQGFGGQIFLFRGGQFEIVNRSLEAQNDPAFDHYVGMLNVDSSAPTDFFRATFGGRNSWFPPGYANHKPVAFSRRGRLIQALNEVRDATSKLYIGGWDGSGVFRYNSGQFGSAPWKSGKGWDALSPSGSHSVITRDLALVNHLGVVFGIGHHLDSDATPITSKWVTKMGWTFDFGSSLSQLNPSQLRRTYRVFSISEDDKRIMGPVTRFLPNALEREHLNSCDAFSFHEDVYYANWIDVLRFPGGSGVPKVMHTSVSTPLAKTFAVWPSGGFVGGNALGETRLLMLEGNGKLYRLKAPASGRELLVDLTDLRVDEEGRPNDNFLTRISSDVLEPGRPPLLLPFNQELHAFAVTKSSGYMHFSCRLDPSGTDRWTDRTDQLPADLQSADGCTYGFVDDPTRQLCLMHVSYSKFGVFGVMGGGQNAGGGFWLYTLDANRKWTEITRGMAGLPPRGLVPYQNYGPWAAVPSGNNPEVFRCSDYAILDYKLFDQFGRVVDVDVEFSTDAGITWNEARQFRDYFTGDPVGSGTSSLPTAPAPSGRDYNFYWDVVNDVGFNNPGQALLRVRPRLVR